MRSRIYTLALAGAMTVTAGCLNAERFLEQFMEARCKWEKACETGFDNEWASIGQCVSEESTRIEELRAECDYDRKQAKVCLDAADAWFTECSGDYKKYQAYLDECELVYTCPGDETGETSETGT